MDGFAHELVGSMSQGADGNPTVAMIEAGFAHHGLRWRYINLEVSPQDLPAAVAGARAMGFRGFNLSIPHKVAVIEHLDGLGTSAEIIGAVNCVVTEPDALVGHRLIGENTDGKGFLASLLEVADPAGQRVVVLGAGGAARAVAVELALAGAEHLTVVNRDPHRGADLALLVSNRCGVPAEYRPWGEAGSDHYLVAPDAGILVNATSIGLHRPDLMPPVDPASLRPGLVVADVVFSPARTRLLTVAAERNCVTLDGLGMLVNQGAEAFRRWTGVEPDRGVLRGALETAMTTP
jgi:shikimate dehydrogenase